LRDARGGQRQDRRFPRRDVVGIAARAARGKLEGVRIGGYAVRVAEGTLKI